MQEQKKETTIHLSVNQNRVGLTSIRKGSSAVQTNFNIFVHQNKSDLETINLVAVKNDCLTHCLAQAWPTVFFTSLDCLSNQVLLSQVSLVYRIQFC